MKRFTLLLATLAAPLLLQAGVRVGTLEVEQRTRPLSVENKAPRLSWIIDADERDVMQTAYHILVATDPALLTPAKADLWNSEVTASDRSVWVPYGGKALTSNRRCYWKVKVYTTQGESPWSETAEWGMGLLGETAWGGRWIGWDAPFEWDKEVVHSELSARYLRTEFDAKKPVKRATLHLSGLGLYELFINGERIGDQVLAPAPTDYRRTVLYNSFDVTKQLRADRNAIGVVLGNGRYYTMRQNYKTWKIPQFGYPKLRLHLVVEYEDGTQQRIVSDPSTWRLTARGPIRSNNEYDGETYDARMELGAWTKAGYDDSQWLVPQRVAVPDGTLRGNTSENMKVMCELPAVKVTPYGDRAIVDFGQNMAGWVRINVRDTQRGDTIRMRYAERLTDCLLYTSPSPRDI